MQLMALMLSAEFFCSLCVFPSAFFFVGGWPVALLRVVFAVLAASRKTICNGAVCASHGGGCKWALCAGEYFGRALAHRAQSGIALTASLCICNFDIILSFVSSIDFARSTGCDLCRIYSLDFVLRILASSAHFIASACGLFSCSGVCFVKFSFRSFIFVPLRLVSLQLCPRHL